jgi:hypothetical protein
VIHLWNKESTGAQCGEINAQNIVGPALFKSIDCPKCLEFLYWSESVHFKQFVDGQEKFDLSERQKKMGLVELNLRRRIHNIEQHNQYFFRCESAWCNPSDDNDPSKRIAVINSLL